MKTKECPSYTATICCGLQRGYDGVIMNLSFAEEVIRSYVDREKLGVTLTPTMFLYPGGSEPGFCVGLINYPRYPSAFCDIRSHAMKIGKLLLEQLGQERLTVILADCSIMLEKDA